MTNMTNMYQQRKSTQHPSLYFGTSKILTNLSRWLQPGLQENSKNTRHPIYPIYLFMTVLHTELLQGLCDRNISLCLVLCSLAGWKTKSAHASVQASQIGGRWHYLCLGCPSRPHTCAIHSLYFSVLCPHHHPTTTPPPPPSPPCLLGRLSW